LTTVLRKPWTGKLLMGETQACEPRADEKQLQV